MKLYSRDYCEEPSELEKTEYKRVLAKEKETAFSFGKSNMHNEYPEAIRHHNSLFPNNHIELVDCKKTGLMNQLTDEFKDLVHNPDTKERDILKFINHKPAHHIIGSLLSRKDFGHHDTYIFPEFPIGGGSFFADYLIVGKNSGGYEFLFVELESPNGGTTIKKGYEGATTRSGYNQIRDWKANMAAEYSLIHEEFKKKCLSEDALPEEFSKYDPSRIHYMIISGLRTDYNEVTYRSRRTMAKEQGIELYHYDNLVDWSKELETKNTF